MIQAPTVEFCQRFKVILESLSQQLICEYLPYRNGKCVLCIGPEESDSTNCGNVKEKHLARQVVRHTKASTLNMTVFNP